MAFCGNCGNQIGEGVRFCPSCGHAIEADAAAQARAAQPQAAPSTEKASYSQYAPAAPVLDEDRDAEENKAMAIIAYLLFFIPLLVGVHKTSRFAKYHTNQGTVLFLAALAWGVVFGILISVLGVVLLAVGAWAILGVITGILTLLSFVPLVFCIIGIINAATGKMKPLPLIGGITIVK